jgi:hypothetical protein
MRKFHGRLLLGAAVAVAAAVAATLPGRGAARPAKYTCPPNYGTCLGPLAPGTYKTKSFQPALTYKVPVGWANFCDHVGALCFTPPGGDYTGVDDGKSDYVDVFTSVATSAGRGCPKDTHSKIHTPTTFVHWLRRLPSLSVSRPASVTIGGLSGYRVDVRLRKHWTKVCPGFTTPPYVETLTGRQPSPSDLSHGIGPRPQVQRLYLIKDRHGTLAIELFARKGAAKLPAYSKVVETFTFAH